MKLEVSNQIRVINPNVNVQVYCENVLTLRNPDYIQREKMNKWLGNTPEFIKLYVRDGNDLILPFGCLDDIWKLTPARTEYKTDFSSFKGNSMIGDINLYDYQRPALEALKKGKNGILQAPCGSGKTNIGLQLIKEIGGKALWLTHTKKLLDQSKKRCEDNFKGDFGTITEGEVNIGKDITFATVQTMSKLEPEIYRNAFDIVIVDECHHCVGSPTRVMQFYKVLMNCNCRYKFGMSATLNRADGLINSVYAIIGKKLYTIDKTSVGDKTIKASYNPVYINLEYNPFDYLNTDGTIDFTSLINMLSNDRERNEIIIEGVKERLGHKQLVLCNRIAQVDYLANEISKFTTVSVLKGSIKAKERNYNADVIVATYSLAKEGLDIPELDTLHLATPQKDKTTVLQSVGRIERNIEGKETPIVYDYVDTSLSYCMHCYTLRRRMIAPRQKYAIM